MAVASVSYTHLDVYKRQLLVPLLLARLTELPPCRVSEGGVPVARPIVIELALVGAIVIAPVVPVPVLAPLSIMILPLLLFVPLPKPLNILTFPVAVPEPFVLPDVIVRFDDDVLSD